MSLFYPEINNFHTTHWEMRETKRVSNKFINVFSMEVYVIDLRTFTI